MDSLDVQAKPNRLIVLVPDCPSGDGVLAQKNLQEGG